MRTAELVGVDRGLRSSWPEAAGLPVATAALLINGDRPDVAVALIVERDPIRPPPPGRSDPRRVTLVSDTASVVVKTPVAG
uniref:Uncharacterized protein n=1 Tax=Aegilops tauschii TaxID=37682 RepID=M8CKC7_AEGTA